MSGDPPGAAFAKVTMQAIYALVLIPGTFLRDLLCVGVYGVPHGAPEYQVPAPGQIIT